MLSRMYIYAVISFLCLNVQLLLAAHPHNFQEAKKQARIIWAAHPSTLYCGCKFDKQLAVKHKSCAYKVKNNPRANRVEWEHLMPASWFGHQRPCWHKPLCATKNNKPFKGRECCALIDKEYTKMYTDLHNLVPAVGEVNEARHNYRFGEFYPNSRQAKYDFHGCNIKIDHHLRMVEPNDAAKGLIARAHLYMAKTYGFKLSDKQFKLFKRWNKKFPPSQWEREWNRKVTEVQGNDNPYITNY